MYKLINDTLESWVIAFQFLVHSIILCYIKLTFKTLNISLEEFVNIRYYSFHLPLIFSDEIEEVTKKLKTATEDLVKLTEEYSAMKTVITETDKTNARLEVLLLINYGIQTMIDSIIVYTGCHVISIPF